MDDVLPAWVKDAADAVTVLLPYLTGTDGQTPVAGAHAQVARQLVDDRLCWMQAAAAAVTTLHPGPDARAENRPMFNAPASALAWFRQVRLTVPGTLALAAAIKADRQLWRTAEAVETLAVHTGDLELWGAVSEAGLQAAQRLGDQEALASMHLMRGGWHKMTRPAGAVPDYLEALRQFRVLHDERRELLTLIRLGAVHLVMRRLPEAQEAFEQVLPRAGEDTVLGLAQMNLTSVHLAAGEYQEAVKRAGRALELLTGSDAHFAVQVYVDLVRCHTRDGDLDAATAALLAGSERATAGAAHAGRHLDLLAAEAELRLAQGRHADTVDLALRWLTCHGQFGTDSGHADIQDLLGQAFLAGGEPVRAVDVHTAALVRRRRADVPFATATTLMHLAAAREAAGYSTDADGGPTEALDLLAGSGYADPAADDLRARLTTLTR